MDRRLIFGDEEKGKMLAIVRQFELFSGVQVLSYCLMGNHFHFLVLVPKAPENIPDQEVQERMRFVYNAKRMDEFEELILQRIESGDIHFRTKLYNSMRARMYDLSSFVKDVKLRFSKWYNANQNRKGTLWEERFKSVLVEGSENAMMRVAAYIELNPVRAGIVNTVSDYAWCSISEAAMGGKRARMGIIRLASGIGSDHSWKDALAIYQNKLVVRIQSQSVHSNQSIPVKQEDHAQSQNTNPLRNRCLTDGLVIGSREFIEAFHQTHIKRLNSRRKTICTPMRETPADGLCSYRNVK
ncbi:MAG: transposase [Verrucomicrobia bacterium]|nr:transposase [Verrucomicrobiota bacterium]